jgi:hypothetical protein
MCRLAGMNFPGVFTVNANLRPSCISTYVFDPKSVPASDGALWRQLIDEPLRHDCGAGLRDARLAAAIEYMPTASWPHPVRLISDDASLSLPVVGPGSKTYSAQFWDAPGLESRRHMSTMYVPHAHASMTPTENTACLNSSLYTLLGILSLRLWDGARTFVPELPSVVCVGVGPSGTPQALLLKA